MTAVLDPPPLVMPLIALLGPFVIVVITLLLHRSSSDTDGN